jgi:hypothetical protein
MSNTAFKNILAKRKSSRDIISVEMAVSLCFITRQLLIIVTKGRKTKK